LIAKAAREIRCLCHWYRLRCRIDFPQLAHITFWEEFSLGGSTKQAYGFSQRRKHTCFVKTTKWGKP
jgi:hypothetical protein